MNLVWPGDRDGNDTERVAFALNRTFADDATHVFDIHSYNKHQAGDVMVRDVPALRDQAARLGHRFVMLRPFPPGKLVSHFYDTGRAGVLYNASGQYLVSEAEVRRALRVLENYAKVIGVLAGPLARGDDPVLFSDTTERIDVVAPTSGLFMDAGLKLCEEVAEGALFGHLLSDRDLQCREIRSPVRGYLRVYGVARPHCDVALPGHHPYVTKGERLAQIVRPIGAEEGPAGERFRSPLSSGLEQIPG